MTGTPLKANGNLYQKAMKRSKPLRRSNKPIRRVTPRRAKQKAEYSRKVRVFKRKYPWCVSCITLWLIPIRPTNDVHHKMGCEGELLLDQRYWLPVCRACHDWIEDHGRAARELGFVLDKDYK